MRRPLLIPLFVLALLGAAPAAPAAEAEAEEPDESALVEAAIEECEKDPVCMAEAEEGEAEVEGEGAEPQCALRSAKAHAAVKRGKLKLTIGYSTYEPVAATIRIDSGARRIGSFQRRLGRSGVLRFAEPLKRGHERKPVVVRIGLATGSSGCPSRRLVLRG